MGDISSFQKWSVLCYCAKFIVMTVSQWECLRFRTVGQGTSLPGVLYIQ